MIPFSLSSGGPMSLGGGTSGTTLGDFKTDTSSNSGFAFDFGGLGAYNTPKTDWVKIGAVGLVFFIAWRFIK